MKKKLICILAVLLLVTSCGKVPKLKNGDEAVVTMKELRDEIVRLSKEQGVFTSEMKGILESVNKLLG